MPVVAHGAKCTRCCGTRRHLMMIGHDGATDCVILLYVGHRYSAPAVFLVMSLSDSPTTGAVLDRQNTSSKQPPAQYGRR